MCAGYPSSWRDPAAPERPDHPPHQPTAQCYHVITDNQFPHWVYGGTVTRYNQISGEVERVGLHHGLLRAKPEALTDQRARRLPMPASASRPAPMRPHAAGSGTAVPPWSTTTLSMLVLPSIVTSPRNSKPPMPVVEVVE